MSSRKYWRHPPLHHAVMLEPFVTRPYTLACYHYFCIVDKYLAALLDLSYLHYWYWKTLPLYQSYEVSFSNKADLDYLGLSAGWTSLSTPLPFLLIFVNYKRFGNTFLIVDLVLDVYDIGVAPVASWIKTLSSCVLNLTQLPLMLNRGFEYINA